MIDPAAWMQVSALQSPCRGYASIQKGVHLIAGRTKSQLEQQWQIFRMVFGFVVMTAATDSDAIHWQHKRPEYDALLLLLLLKLMFNA